jgi:hypothetical protein
LRGGEQILGNQGRVETSGLPVEYFSKTLIRTLILISLRRS